MASRQPKKLRIAAPNVTLGRLQTWMMRHNITIKELAEGCGVSYPTARLWRQGSPEELLPKRAVITLVGYVIMTGLGGLFEMKYVDIKIAKVIADGFFALETVPSDRSVAQCHAIANARKTATRIAEEFVQTPGVTAHDPGSDGTEGSDGQPDTLRGSPASGPGVPAPAIGDGLAAF